MEMEMKTQVLFALIFLVVMTLIIFKKEVMEFLREKTGIVGNSKKNEGNEEDDSAG